MGGRDGYGDPIPPGHGEPRRYEDGKIYEEAPARVETGQDTPFGPSPAPVPQEMFGVPRCGRCWYFHTPEEGCTR